MDQPDALMGKAANDLFVVAVDLPLELSLECAARGDVTAADSSTEVNLIWRRGKSSAD